MSNFFQKLIDFKEQSAGFNPSSLYSSEFSDSLISNSRLLNTSSLPTITIAASDSSAAEVITGQTANPGAFRITRTGATTTALTVSYTVGGTATKGSDYNNVTGNTTNTGTITIPVGATSITLPINIIDDTVVEGNETVILSLGTNNAYSLGATTSATVTVADNDKPVVTITASDNSAAEVTTGQTANPGVFTVTRTGPTTTALTVSYTVGGTATKGSDYNNVTGNTTNTGTITIPVGATSITLPINIIDDTVVEGNETVILSLGTNNAYSLGTTTSATVTVADNDKPVVTIRVSDGNAAEVRTGQTANPGVFTVTRTGPTTTALTVSYTVGGTATKGSDYNNVTGNTTNTGTITIPVGATSITLPINIIDDTVVEGNETVILSLGTNNAYSLGATTSATVTVADNDSIVDPVAARFSPSGNNDIDGLLSSSPFQYYWNTSNNGGIITYSFYQNTSGSYYGTEAVSEVSNAVKSSVRNILAHLSTYINVRFVEVADTATSYGVIRYMYSDGGGNSDFYAYAYLPGSSAITGDVHLNRDFESDPVNAFSQGYGSYGYTTLIHETLHSLGLKHPGNYNGSGTASGPFLLPEQDNNTNTIMTYNGGGGNPTTAMAYDIRALQYLYGAKSNNLTNTTYSFRFVDSYSVNGTFFGTDQYDIKQTIWDTGGVDTFDLSALDTGTYVMDLTQGGILTRLSNYENEYYQDRTTGGYYQTSGLGTTIAYNTIIENVINSRGNDHIQGNEVANTFKGYTRGTYTGNDVYYLTTTSDTLELTGYALSNITTTISGNNLTINLGTYGSIEVEDYFNTSNSSMRFQIGGNYYRYNRTSGWQSVSAAAIANSTSFNANHIYETGGLTARQLSQSEIATGNTAVIACECQACLGNSNNSSSKTSTSNSSILSQFANGRLGGGTLMEIIGLYN